MRTLPVVPTASLVVAESDELFTVFRGPVFTAGQGVPSFSELVPLVFYIRDDGETGGMVAARRRRVLFYKLLHSMEIAGTRMLRSAILEEVSILIPSKSPSSRGLACAWSRSRQAHRRRSSPPIVPPSGPTARAKADRAPRQRPGAPSPLTLSVEERTKTSLAGRQGNVWGTLGSPHVGRRLARDLQVRAVRERRESLDR